MSPTVRTASEAPKELVKSVTNIIFYLKNSRIVIIAIR
jgi:hypothetical protein